jgi:hypothetical protein
MSMAESFELPVVYEHKSFHLAATFEQTGYTHRITIHLEGTDIYFEPDEEKNYRAILKYNAKGNKEINPAYLQAIAKALEEHLK